MEAQEGYPDTRNEWVEQNKEYISLHKEHLKQQFTYTMSEIINADQGAWNMGVKDMPASEFIANELPQNNAPQFYEAMVSSVGEEAARPYTGETAMQWVTRMVVESTKS